MSEVVTLQEFSEHLNFAQLRDNDPRRPQLQRTLNAAVRIVAARCGPLVEGQSTLRVRASGQYLVVPATDLAEVLQVLDPHGRLVEHDPRRSNLAAGIVAVPRTSIEGFWEVQARVNGLDVPDDLALAILIIGSHLWETQRGRSGRPEVFAGSENADVQDVPRGFAVPARAVELMRPYFLPTVA